VVVLNPLGYRIILKNKKIPLIPART